MTAKILPTKHSKWMVAKMVLKSSSRTSGDYYEVTLINGEYDIIHTYVDDSNRNRNYWKDVVDLYKNGISAVVSGLTVMKDKVHYKTKEPLVNADSRPIIHRGIDLDEAIEEMYDHYLSMEPINERPLDSELFSFR